MKYIYENSEIFTAYAMIDMNYYFIKNSLNKLNISQTPIQIMIDNACEYNRIGEIKETIISCLKEIIKHKKIIEADYSGDEKMLNQILEI